MAVTFALGCPGGECDKLDDALSIVALDAFGERVVGDLASLTGLRLPGPDPMIEIRVGIEPRPAAVSSVWYQILAGSSCPDGADAICLVGDGVWLPHALAAVVQLTTLPGIICIDFADLRTAFHGRGPVRGTSVAGPSLADAGVRCVDEAVELLRGATWALVHVQAGPPATLADVVQIVEAVERVAFNREIEVLFNFYAATDGAARVTLLCV